MDIEKFVEKWMPEVDNYTESKKEMIEDIYTIIKEYQRKGYNIVSPWGGKKVRRIEQ